MKTLFIVGIVLGTIIIISLHHLFNWIVRKAFKDDSGNEPFALLGTILYIFLNIMYIMYLYELFTELNKIS